MKKRINWMLMGLYLLSLVTGLILTEAIFIYISTALAAFTFLYVQNQESSKSLDEREKLIVERAASLAFQILIAILIVFSIGSDFIDVLEFISLPNLLSVLMGLGFMVFVSTYEYYQTKF